MKYKTFELKFKAEDLGSVEGYFSTYDKTPDSYGDIIEPGAFTETFEKREKSGHPFPLCFNHDFSAVIGAVKSVKDTEKGPFISADFLDTALAQDVRKMLQSGAIYQFSFAYDILEARKPTAEEYKAGVTGLVLTKLEVFEISVVTVPANQNAVATEVKAGKRNSKADEDVIRENIRELFDIVEDLNELAANINTRIESLRSLIDTSEEDTEEERAADVEEAEPEVNESTDQDSEEQKDVGNSKDVAELLEKIKKITEA